MKTRDILSLHAAIERLSQDAAPKPAKFAYALARNLRSLEPLVAAHRDALKGDWMPPLEAFERERQELVMRHARRGDDGNVLTLAGNRAVLDDPQAFSAALDGLQARHPDVQGAQVRFEERQNELLDVEEEVALFMLDLAQLPEEIDVATMSALLPMIREGDL